MKPGLSFKRYFPTTKIESFGCLTSFINLIAYLIET